MRIEGNTIIFKSNPEYYFNEFLGLKCNTVRKIQNEELTDFNIFRQLAFKWIEIHLNSQDGKDEFYFKREVTNICRFEGFWIISWRHE